jgi:hypothetical protein
MELKLNRITNPELEVLLKHMERFNEINKSDIPNLIKLVKELEVSNQLGWKRLREYESFKTFISQRTGI